VTTLTLDSPTQRELAEVTVLLSRPATAHHAASHPGDAISQGVQTALAGAQVERQIERRTETRHPYPYPIHMTPVDRSGRALLDETFVVVGKHLSNHGVDFYFAQPVGWSRVIASFPHHDGQWIGLLMDLTWCRFSRHGWYDNGGRFVELVESPLSSNVAA
jgi:hypothetical protein